MKDNDELPSRVNPSLTRKQHREQYQQGMRELRELRELRERRLKISSAPGGGTEAKPPMPGASEPRSERSQP